MGFWPRYVVTWTCKEWDVIQIVYVIFSVLYDEYAIEHNHAVEKQMRNGSQMSIIKNRCCLDYN